MADPFTFLNNPIVTYLLFFAVIGMILYWKFGGKGKDEATEFLLKQVAMDYGRQEIRKHTLKELDSISHLFLPYNRGIYRQGYDGEVKIGRINKVQDLIIPENTVLEYDKQGRSIKKLKEADGYIKDAKYMLILYKTPVIEMLDFFPLSFIVTDILGSRHYMFITDKNILYHNKDRLMLNVTEFTSMFDIVVPVDNIDIMLPKIKDLVQKGFNEELMGRMETLPSNVALMALQHTMNLDIEKQRAETTAKILDSQRLVPRVA
jgi:hypothetical protein